MDFDAEKWTKIGMVLAIIIIVMVPVGYVVSLLVAQLQFTSSGTTKSASLVMTDMNGDPKSDLLWSNPGNGTDTQNTKVENTGSVTLNLTLSTTPNVGWATLGWNATDYPLAPSGVVVVEWTLTITDAPQNAGFSIGVTVVGTEV